MGLCTTTATLTTRCCLRSSTRGTRSSPCTRASTSLSTKCSACRSCRKTSRSNRTTTPTARTTRTRPQMPRRSTSAATSARVVSASRSSLRVPSSYVSARCASCMRAALRTLHVRTVLCLTKVEYVGIDASRALSVVSQCSWAGSRTSWAPDGSRLGSLRCGKAPRTSLSISFY